MILQPDFLEPIAPEFRCSLGEGNTPLLRSGAVAARLGLKNLFLKCEHQNPTGSYKDRFIAAELSLLRQAGAELVLGTSSGNTGSSLAAYAARYNLPCYLFACEKTPSGKLLQMKAHGAKVFRVRDFCISQEVSLQVMQRLGELSVRWNTRPTISAFTYAPEGMRGVQGIGYECTQQLEVLSARPQHVFTPAGGCGLHVATARGFIEAAAQRGSTPPRAHIVQPRLNDTVVTALRTSKEPKASPTTTAISGLAVPQILDAPMSLQLAKQTGGNGFLIEDEEATYWQRVLLREEGIWVEPAGAVSVAGLARAAKEGAVGEDETIVCILTGHGFKAPETALDSDAPEEMMIEASELDAVFPR